ncbi:hypothetical protein UFOVP345_6 [uncultured Caudovirales phage]|uniref:Uncharacterized protein n=1 Tax=uncultured Caudovirales phage TaxID=2100421 RepID=A0A6J5M528_9CAUD|nr:hypothetical protein UFOVP345_6 [uncultured Caudovirales phage]
MGRDTLTGAQEAVLIEAYRRPFTISSNYARANKEAIAELSCLGLLTVYYPDPVVHGHDVTDHTWRPTIKGLQYIILDT